jgi:hypothetical protein
MKSRSMAPSRLLPPAGADREETLAGSGAFRGLPTVPLRGWGGDEEMRYDVASPTRCGTVGVSPGKQICSAAIVGPPRSSESSKMASQGQKRRRVR